MTREIGRISMATIPKKEHPRPLYKYKINRPHFHFFSINSHEGERGAKGRGREKIGFLGFRMSSGSAKKSFSIPSKMKETVQNLKVIVNCTEQEIYSMLKECNMDPNEAVHRLLTQDTFHEVKSKREKKKEIRGMGDSRPQKVSSSSGSGVSGGADYAGQSAAQTNSDDYYEITRVKPVRTKENGARNSHIVSVLGSERTANSTSASTAAPSSYNDAIGSTIHFPVLSESTSVPPPSSTLQHNCGGGQLSMADIVKMGMQRKPSSSHLVATEVCDYPALKIVPNTSQAGDGRISITDIPLGDNQEIHSKRDTVFRTTEVSHELGIVVGQHEPLEEWTFVDHSPEETPVLVDVSGASSIYHDPSTSSSLHIDENSSHLSLHVDYIKKSGHVSAKNLPTETTISDGQLRAYGSGRPSFADDGPYMNGSFSQQHEAADVHEDLSTTTANMHNLSLQTEDQGSSLTEENPAVIIPDHLHVTNTDCSHLSFGSFGPGVDASLHLLKSANSNLVVTVAENAPSLDYSDTRHSDYYNHEQLRTASDDSVSPITGTISVTCDMVSSSTLQPEFSIDDTFISEQPSQYDNPSVSSFPFSDTIQPDAAAYNRAQATYQMQDPTSSLTSLTESHTDSAPRNLLDGNAQPLRELDLPFPHLLANQSMPTKYKPSMSSFCGPATSMPEVLKSGLFSNFHQSVPQTTSSTTITGGSALPPHLTLPAYSQPTLPLGPLTNMFNYPTLAQSITYMPFSGSSSTHQSSACLQSAGMKYALPQLKSSMPLNGLPQSLPVGSGYGGFGGSTNFPGAYLQNFSNISVGSAIGYEEALRSQYNESVTLHQGNSWLSRTMPPAPGSSFYGTQGPSQQVLRQSEQPAQMGMMGYPNSYHTQVGGISREHQLQLQIHGSLSGSSQGQPSQQSLWQHQY